MPTSVLVILLCSLPILLLSRRALVRPATHGFYRFFVFETILVLVVLNADAWFTQPFAPRQLASWVLLVTSIWLALHGFYLLHAVGRSAESRGGANLPFEDTARLVTTGPFRFVRHPLYASLLCLAWGAALKSFDSVSVGLALGCTALLVVMAKIEERENLASFGEEYRTYMRRTRMFVPWVW
jgi:protein-S-isoprenylcysteine O-methyltransferase Ste14